LEDISVLQRQQQQQQQQHKQQQQQQQKRPSRGVGRDETASSLSLWHQALLGRRSYLGPSCERYHSSESLSSAASAKPHSSATPVSCYYTDKKVSESS